MAFQKRKTSTASSNLTRVTSTVIVPVATLKHVGTGLYSIVLGINLRGKWELKTLPRTAIANIRHIPELANYGVDVDSENARLLMRFLSDMLRANKDRIPETLVTDRLGFVNDGQDGFMHGPQHIAASPLRVKVQYEPGESGNGGNGYAFRASGTMEGWRVGADLLTTYPIPMLVMIASLTAPMLTVLNGQCLSFTVSLAGRSTTGKSISQKCGCSAWGNPKDLCHSWDTTKIGLERLLGLYSNLPLFLDDTKRAKNDDIVRDTIYMVQQEQGMGRGKPGGLANVERWRLVLISSGESSLGSYFTDGGAFARYLEVNGMPFGSQSEAIATIVGKVDGLFQANHGHAGPAFIEALFKMKQDDGWERIRNRHLQIHSEFTKETKGGIGARIASYAAALQVTAETAVQAGLLPDAYLKVIPNLWPEFARQTIEAPEDHRAMLALLGWMGGHQEHFWGRNRKYGEKEVEPSTGFVGAWDSEKHWKKISFIKFNLEAILRELGFRQPEGVLRAWKNRGYLITDKDANRLERTTTFRGEPMRMVVIQRSAFDQVQDLGSIPNEEEVYAEREFEE